MAMILIGFALILLLDLLPIVRRRSWRGAIGFFLFFIPALTLAILRQKNVEVPSLMLALGDWLKSWGISY
ncbi:MAG: hypothetical protein AAGU12_00095 [Clostridiales bacterium]